MYQSLFKNILYRVLKKKGGGKEKSVIKLKTNKFRNQETPTEARSLLAFVVVFPGILVVVVLVGFYTKPAM